MTRSWLLHLGSVVACLVITATCTYGATTGRNVLIEFRAVSLPIPAAFSVVSMLSRAEATEADFRALDEMVRKGSAELVSHSVLWLDGSAKATSAGGEELQHPVEFDPPHEPSIFGTGTTLDFHPPYTIAPPWGEMVPTTFDGAELGTKLEAATQVDPENGRITLALTASIKSFVEFRTFPGATSPLGTTGIAVQPTFSVQRVTATLLLSSERSAVCGSFFLETPAPRLLLFIVRASSFQ